MTEDQIERRAQRRMDALDAQLLRGEISQQAYDAEIHALAERTDQEHDRARLSAKPVIAATVLFEGKSNFHVQFSDGPRGFRVTVPALDLNHAKAVADAWNKGS